MRGMKEGRGQGGFGFMGRFLESLERLNAVDPSGVKEDRPVFK